MILRDVVIAEQARTLGRVSPPDGLRHERSFAAALLEPPLRASSDEEPCAEPSVPVPAPITFEQVAAWLAVQDGDTREACASLLAEDLAAVHEKARASGYEAGEKRAMAEAARNAERLIATLAQLVSAAELAFEQERIALAEDCTDVVAEVLAKIAGSALASRDAIVGTTLNVLGRMKDDREATIRVHADDLPVLQQEQSKLALAFGPRKFSLIADSRVTVGGCIVETSRGSLDGRLEVQLREMCETLRAAKAGGREPA